MSLRLVINPRHCIGCRACEMACAFSHGEGGQIAASRCQTVTLSQKDGQYVPMMCLQCEHAACVQVCPVGALRRDESRSLVIVDNDLCIRCMACVVACPFGNMHYDPIRALIHKCDLCQDRGGVPRCALFCPTRCLTVEPLPA